MINLRFNLETHNWDVQGEGYGKKKKKSLKKKKHFLLNVTSFVDILSCIIHSCSLIIVKL